MIDQWDINRIQRNFVDRSKAFFVKCTPLF